MHADEVQVSKLFAQHQQLRIPTWQRRYSWSHENWSELWDDLARVEEAAARTHFLGSFVLKAWPHAGMPGDAHQYWVVDGQQRLTTLTILLVAIRDRIQELIPNEVDGAMESERLTWQMLRNRDVRDGHEFRLVLQPGDDEDLQALIDGSQEERPDSLIARCHAFFMRKLREEASESLDQRFATVLSRFQGVWVILDSDDNSHRVFQTLNAGGKQLEQSDLVRNYFFLLLGDHAEAFYEERWLPMERSLGSRLSRYFVAWTTAAGHTGSVGSLFSYFQSDMVDIEDDVGSVMRYGTELADSAQSFNAIYGEPEGISAGYRIALQDLQRWGTRPAEALLFYLLNERRQGRLSDHDTALAMELVLSFMARRFAAGFQPNLLRPIFREVVHRLRSRPTLDGADTVPFLQFLLSSGSELRAWPRDQEVMVASANTRIYTSSRARWVFLLLERVNRARFDNPKLAPDQLPLAKYTVEHVMPQTLSPAWVDDLEDWGVQDIHGTHQSKVHVLGNLTLSAINPELSNKRFSSKRDIIQDDYLRLNLDLKTQPAWTPDSIDARGQGLARSICEAFVSPLSKEEVDASEFRAVEDDMPPADLDEEAIDLDEGS